MGLASSILQNQEHVASQQKIHEKKFDPNKKKEFIAQVLHDSYLTHPLRASTIEAAAEYTPSDPNSTYLMPGTHKHLGGAYDPTDGCIYGVPANAKAVLCLYPKDGTYHMTCIPLPPRVADTRFKWLRGIFAHGYLWAIPAWADCVLCVDVDAFWKRRVSEGEEIVHLLELPKEHIPSTWQWHGAAINKEKTAIYCIPSNAKQVLKVDVLTKKTSFIDIEYDTEKYINFNLDFSNKWYGGILGDDNAVYGVCYRSCAVLRIDCETETATLIGPDFGIAGYNWHGGLKINGKIYAHPSHAPDTVLVIDTRPGVEERCHEIPIHRAEYDKDDRQTYKWLGGCVGADGNIYCPACDTSSVLKIDTRTDTCMTFGFAGKLKNKWQGGILGRDGCIYCIPASGYQVLRIATSPDIQGENPIQLLGNLPVHKDKWQGGHVGLDGSLYFIPENGYRVMKVTPPASPPKTANGKLPEGDVLIEML